MLVVAITSSKHQLITRRYFLSAYVRALLAVALVFGVVGIGATAIACGDDDGGGVEVINGEPDPEADPEPDPEADPEADPEPDPEADPEAGVATPGPKPADAEQVGVTLAEWEIRLDRQSAPAGEIYFLVENAGPDDPHEFVVIRTDEAPDALPVEEGRVPDDEVDLVDEIEPFEPGSIASITLNLEPGSYVLICNIAEVEDGEIESHYEEGMRTAFTVE